MNPRTYAGLAAVIFSIAAALQLLRAILAWPASVETTWWGKLSVPVWPSWIGFLVFAVLALLGFSSSHRQEY